MQRCLDGCLERGKPEVWVDLHFYYSDFEPGPWWEAEMNGSSLQSLAPHSRPTTFSHMCSRPSFPYVPQTCTVKALGQCRAGGSGW